MIRTDDSDSLKQASVDGAMTLNAPTFILVILFGSSAWMGTNAVWMQLPLITAVLPEGWTLPSYLAAVVQIACIGPLVYGVASKCLCTVHAPTLIISSLVFLLGCSFALVAFWDLTVWIATKQYSIALYVLMFGIALVNSTSNVLFMPFMAQFHPAYLNAYFGGMGLSSLVPSVLSLVQGSSNYDCVPSGNVTVPVYKDPRFGVSTFYFVIASWTILAFVSFIVLFWTGAHKKHRHIPTPLPGEKTFPESDPDEETPLRSPEERERDAEGEATSSIQHQQHVQQHIEEHHSPLSDTAYWWILLMTALVNAQMNGVIPSIHSYAALPYSQTVYHLGVTFSNIVSPLSSFLPFVVQVRSVGLLTLLSLMSSLFTAFVVFLATQSPNYFAGDFTMGAILAVACPMVAAGLHSFLRTLFASLLREGSHGSERRLFWCGVFIQVGSFIGSAVMFPLVNVAHLFQQAPACR